MGFVDTALRFGPNSYGDGGAYGNLANQFAAMPSLHFAWAVVVAWAMIKFSSSRWRYLAVLHPVLTLLRSCSRRTTTGPTPPSGWCWSPSASSATATSRTGSATAFPGSSDRTSPRTRRAPYRPRSALTANQRPHLGLTAFPPGLVRLDSRARTLGRTLPRSRARRRAGPACPRRSDVGRASGSGRPVGRLVVVGDAAPAPLQPERPEHDPATTVLAESYALRGLDGRAVAPPACVRHIGGCVRRPRPHLDLASGATRSSLPRSHRVGSRTRRPRSTRCRAGVRRVFGFDVSSRAFVPVVPRWTWHHRRAHPPHSPRMRVDRRVLGQRLRHVALGPTGGRRLTVPRGDRHADRSRRPRTCSCIACTVRQRTTRCGTRWWPARSPLRPRHARVQRHRSLADANGSAGDARHARRARGQGPVGEVCRLGSVRLASSLLGSAPVSSSATRPSAPRAGRPHRPTSSASARSAPGPRGSTPSSPRTPACRARPRRSSTTSIATGTGRSLPADATTYAPLLPPTPRAARRRMVARLSLALLGPAAPRSPPRPTPSCSSRCATP